MNLFLTASYLPALGLTAESLTRLAKSVRTDGSDFFKQHLISGRHVLPSLSNPTVRQAEDWWLVLWGVSATALITVAFFVPFRWWVIAAAVGFGIMEAIGVLGKNPKYPPLTDVIRCYIPRWGALMAMLAALGGAASVWGLNWGNHWGCALFFGLGAWLTNHFTVRYDQAASD